MVRLRFFIFNYVSRQVSNFFHRAWSLFKAINRTRMGYLNDQCIKLLIDGGAEGNDLLILVTKWACFLLLLSKSPNLLVRIPTIKLICSIYVDFYLE